MNTPQNRLNIVINDYEAEKKTPFKPSHAFYKFIKIGKRRFHQLMRNEKPLMFDEMQRLSDYFDVHILELHESTIKFLPNEPVTN